jgi:outer membrane lipoprotein-sorting protein
MNALVRAARFAAFAALLAAASGCAGGSASRTAVRGATWQEIHAAVDQQRGTIRQIVGDGRLSLETPDIAQSGSFELMLRKPDSLLLRIEGPFGIRVGSVLLTRDSMKFYSSLENRLYLGSARPANLRRIFRVEASVDDLMSLLGGGGFLAEDSGAPDSVTADEDGVVLWYSSNGLTRRYLADNASRLLRRIQVLDEHGRLVLEHAFMEFRQADGLTVPYLLRTIRPRERQMFSLRYSNLALNARPEPFSFAVPSSAEVVRWHE